MSSTYDADYLELCRHFKERSHFAKLILDTSDDRENDEEDFEEINSFHYNWITGFRKGSELMWATEEECLYVSNAKIVK